MSSPRILVVIGTPIPDTFNHALAAAYTEAARIGGAEVRVVDLASDPVPAPPASFGEVRMPRRDSDGPLSDDVRRYIDDVDWAEHLVFFFPQWWGSVPAALKNWIDRVFVSGFAFRARPDSRFWDRLLTGRTARIVETMDSPGLWNALVYRDAAIRTLRTATLEYCGIKVRGVARLDEVRRSTPERRAGWITKMAGFGTTDTAAAVTRTAAAPVSV